jgi:hypothetical protein
MAGSSADGTAAARRRTVELVAAAAVALLGMVVAGESLRHDIRWDANGPAPGYFPFRIGLLIVAASLAILFKAARGAGSAVFVTDREIQRSFSVFWPTALLGAAMFALGCYVPAVVYLAWMMRAHGRFHWTRAIAAAFLAVAVIFVVFEVWLQVPLAKGPIETAFGIY